MELSDLNSSLDNIVIKLMEESQIPGLQIVLFEDGKISMAKNFGVKDLLSTEPVKDDTIFPAASLSKVIFAFGVLKLVEKNVLNLDTPLIDYIGDYFFEKNFLKNKIDDERFRDITARHALTNSTGFPNWRRKIEGLKIQFQPGEKFGYSGEGFHFLQLVVEFITGKKLNDFMTDELFTPLNMKNSSFVWKESFESKIATGHTYDGERKVTRKHNFASASGSLYTTAHDYAKFFTYVLNRKGLKPELFKEMLKPDVKVEIDNSRSIRRALGFGLELRGEEKIFWHWGDAGVFRCYALGMENKKSGVIFLTNSYNGLSITEDLLNAALGITPPLFSFGVNPPLSISGPGVSCRNLIINYEKV